MAATVPSLGVEWLLPMFATPIFLAELAICAVCGGRNLRKLYVVIVLLTISTSLLFLYDVSRPNKAVISTINTYEYANWARPKAILPYTAVIRAKAASLNPADYKLINNLALVPFLRWFMPQSPALDVAGVVTEVGPMCTNLKPGDEVFAGGAGVVREYTLISCIGAGKLPKGVDFVHGAAAVTVGMTALSGLDGNLQKGDTLLVIGSAGGCGQAAILVAKLQGLPKEIGCIASSKNRDISLQLGCDKFFDYTSSTFQKELLEHYKDGVDVVYDSVSEPFPLHGSYLDLLLPKTRRAYLTLLPSFAAKLSEHRAKHIGVSAIPRESYVKFMETHSDLFNKLRIAKVSDGLSDIKNVLDSYDLLKSKHAQGKIVLTLDKNQNRST